MLNNSSADKQITSKRNVSLKKTRFYTNIVTSHCAVNLVRYWDINIKYFLSSKVIRRFNILNKNRLKNIFYLVLNDDLVWLGVVV